MLVSIDVVRADVRSMLYASETMRGLGDPPAMEADAECARCAQALFLARERARVLSAPGLMVLHARDVETLGIGNAVKLRVYVSHVGVQSASHESEYFIVACNGEARLCKYDDIVAIVTAFIAPYHALAFFARLGAFLSSWRLLG